MEKKAFPKWTAGSIAIVSFYDDETRTDDVRLYEVTAREGSVVTMRERNTRRAQSDLVSSAKIVLANGYKSSRVVNGTLAKGLTDPNGVVRLKNGLIGTLWNGKEAIYAQEETVSVGSPIEEAATSGKIKEGDILIATPGVVWDYEDYYFNSRVWHTGQTVYPEWTHFDHDFYVVESVTGDEVNLNLLLPQFSEVNGKKGEMPYLSFRSRNNRLVWLNATAKGIVGKDGKVKVTDGRGRKQTAVVWNGVPASHSITE